MSLVRERALIIFLKKCFPLIIPRSDQWSWTPPVGYTCVYESWFHLEAMLCLPILRLITTYCNRRDISLSQLMTWPIMIFMAFMVWSAEIDLSVGVGGFEEMCQVQVSKNGCIYTKMRPKMNIQTDHPSKTHKSFCHNFFVKMSEWLLRNH